MLASPREAVILAAGFSTRLRDYIKEISKVLHPIMNRPLICFPLEVLMSIGIRDFKIVANSMNYFYLKSVLKSFTGAIRYELIINNKPELGNGYSALLGASYIKSRYFILSMADHIYAPSVVKKLLIATKEEFDVIVGGDSSPQFIDIKEATKIYVKGDKVVRIGKNLEEYTHVDIGLFIVKRKVLDIFDHKSLYQKLSWSDIINRLVKEGYIVRVADIRGDYWTEIDTPHDLMQILNGDRRVVVKRVLEQLETKWRYEVPREDVARSRLLLK
ncbi:MAG: phosphocholine cytidylyltransferase family protein [Candidatus Njordarchaeales archaeon]